MLKTGKTETLSLNELAKRIQNVIKFNAECGMGSRNDEPILAEIRTPKGRNRRYRGITGIQGCHFTFEPDKADPTQDFRACLLYLSDTEID